MPTTASTNHDGGDDSDDVLHRIAQIRLVDVRTLHVISSVPRAERQARSMRKNEDECNVMRRIRRRGGGSENDDQYDVKDDETKRSMMKRRMRREG